MRTVPVSQLRSIQHQAPDGGAAADRDELTAGMVVAVHGGWGVVEDISPRRGSSVLQILEADGSRAVRFLKESAGLEARTGVQVHCGEARCWWWPSNRRRCCSARPSSPGVAIEAHRATALCCRPHLLDGDTPPTPRYPTRHP